MSSTALRERLTKNHWSPTLHNVPSRAESVTAGPIFIICFVHDFSALSATNTSCSSSCKIVVSSKQPSSFSFSISSSRSFWSSCCHHCAWSRSSLANRRPDEYSWRPSHRTYTNPSPAPPLRCSWFSSSSWLISFTLHPIRPASTPCLRLRWTHT